jgi:hypothetical protein
MRKPSLRRTPDSLRPEYDLTKLKGGIQGKYYQQAKAGTNLVLIAPDLRATFPDTDSVNRALRLLVQVSSAAIAGSSVGGRRNHKRTPRKSG